MKRPKIVMIGGGSYGWAPNIIKDMLLTDPLQDAEYVLYDTNKSAADLVARVLAQVQKALGTRARIVSTDQRVTAFKGADYFIITITTGGLKAMAQDISIPEKYGIYHTVGDTSGPGGWARLIRNYDVFCRLAADMNRYAPGAMVLNYTNPMTTLTKVLSLICEGPVVGLCHGLFENLRFVQKLYGIKNENDISAQYAGLNHFFWITELRVPGRDILADLRRRIWKKGFTEICKDAGLDPMGFMSNRGLATELFRLTKVMPYLGDRHTCEFFPCYITSQKNMKKYSIVRTSVQQRAEMAKARKIRVTGWAENGIPDQMKKRSRETAADIVAAHVKSQVFIDVGNLPNIGQISSLPPGTVVETAMRVDRNGFSPITFGPLPEPIQGFVAPYARVFDLTVEACLEKNKALALQALRLDPVCSHLNTDQVNEMGERLLHAHRKFIPMF